MGLHNYPAFPDSCRKSLSGMCREYVGNVSLGIIPFGKTLSQKLPIFATNKTPQASLQCSPGGVFDLMIMRSKRNWKPSNYLINSIS